MAASSENDGHARFMKHYANVKPEVGGTTREILEKYSKIPADKVEEHCIKIREAGMKIHPHPCIGTFRFLDLSISYLPAYKEVIDRLKNDDNVLLDLGCCFGQDIRRLVYDGAPRGNLYAADLRLSFVDIGYDLFLDRDSLNVKFFEADVFDENSALQQLDGKVDIIVASAFFHLFDWDEQKAIARRVIKLLKPQPGSLLMGRQVGNEETRRVEPKNRPGQFAFRHNFKTWKQMWDEVGKETDTKWDISVGADAMDDLPNRAQPHEMRSGDIMWLVFTVRRI